MILSVFEAEADFEFTEDEYRYNQAIFPLSIPATL
jgi:hypothetical protein